jgi:hypothetical protein
MKISFFILLTTLSSFAFSAQKNPLIRACHTLGGDFVVAQTSNDQVGFCQFDKALIGALGLMHFENKEFISQSISTYLKGQTACEPTGVIQTVIILRGESMQVCAYADGSLIELGTLIKGYKSDDNKKLNTALGLAF